MNLVGSSVFIRPHVATRRRDSRACLFTRSVTRRRKKLLYLLLALELPMETLFLL